MASLSSKVKTYLANNGVNEVDFMVDVLLQDDSNGQGPYIKSWNVSGVAQPTSEQLDAVDSAADLEERQNAVRATRRNAYGDIGASSTCSTTIQWTALLHGRTTLQRSRLTIQSQLNKEVIQIGLRRKSSQYGTI